jgi:DNA-binding response OmpR family regulator
MKENKISQAGKPASAPLQCPANFPLRILVVEDDGDIRRLNAEALIRCGYHVDAAADGAAAWEALGTDNYDLMITDNHMPKLTGVDLLKKLHSAHMAMPVIMATGTLPTWEFALYSWLLPAAMLLKPYTIEELLETVRVVLHATDSAPGQLEPVQDWQSQPSANGLQLC